MGKPHPSAPPPNRREDTIVDAALLRELAVRAESDPRSVRKALAKLPVKGLAGHRIRRVLREAGLLPAE